MGTECVSKHDLLWDENSTQLKKARICQ